METKDANHELKNFNPIDKTTIWLACACIILGELITSAHTSDYLTSSYSAGKLYVLFRLMYKIPLFAGVALFGGGQIHIFQQMIKGLKGKPFPLTSLLKTYIVLVALDAVLVLVLYSKDELSYGQLGVMVICAVAELVIGILIAVKLLSKYKGNISKAGYAMIMAAAAAFLSLVLGDSIDSDITTILATIVYTVYLCLCLCNSVSASDNDD